MTLFGADVPRPSAGELMLYLLGPGIGESLVAIMPDGRTVVVDVCMTGSTNVTLALLQSVGVKTIDLMVVTHPDLDHVRGLGDILNQMAPRELWRYPLEARAREFALAWARKKKRGQLATALEALAHFVKSEAGETFSAMYGDRVWPHDAAAYRIHSLAPTTYDIDLASRAWDRRLARGPAALHRWLDDVAAGKRSLGDAPNLVSLALVIEFGSRRILLGGDVLRGTRSPKSGWKGIERLLTKHQRLHLLQSLAAVKVAHHGSRGAFDAGVWTHHTTGAAAGEPVALIAPFTPSGLPDRATLVHLRGHARIILLADAGPDAQARLAGAGWKISGAPRITTLTQTLAPCVAINLDAAGGLRSFVGGRAVGAT